MKTDFPSSPLPFPDANSFKNELAYTGGPAIISKEHRKTLFPIITKEDLLQMMVSQKNKPEQVVAQFTEEYRKYVGAEFAIATASGTSSLHLALVGAGVQPGDEVITSAFSFIATAQSIVAAKAIPVFVDIDPITFCIDPEQIEKAITPRTKAIMPIHVHGLPANIFQLRQICAKNNLLLIEDASHAHSASINGVKCGAMGDSAGQSLMADKNFPVGGEGGIAFFKTRESYDRAMAFLNDSGIDYRMSWIAAAFGISQLRRLAYYDAIRSRNTTYLTDELKATKLFSGPQVPEGFVHSYNMYRIKLNPDNLYFKDIEIWKIKAAIQDLLVAEGVPAREWQNCPIPGHIPFQDRKGFGKGYPFNLSERKDFGYAIENFPNTLSMLESTLVLCRELRSPVEYERIQAYALAFKKVANNPEKIREVALTGNYQAPYKRSARLG
jgi:dTDP-4-amino-4,6-dideoxygalactose transaminase